MTVRVVADAAGNRRGRHSPAVGLAEERRGVLAALEAAVSREDPRFADGLRAGRPVAPREYRAQATRLVLTVLVGVEVVMFVVRLDVLVVAAGVTALAWSARRR